MTIFEKCRPWFSYLQPTVGEFGLEIETETLSSGDYPKGFIKDGPPGPQGQATLTLPTMKNWSGHYDNSLRNFGLEFVLKEPLKFEQVNKALDEFEEKTRGVKFIQNAPSTSVHIHWNVMAEEFLTMANFCSLYTLYENLLIAFAGPTRRSNLFALPMRVAEKVVGAQVKMFEALSKGKAQLVFNDGTYKYASLNLSSISRIGSLEIRCMRGTTDVAEIKEWLSIINHIVLCARSPGLTPDIILNMQRDDPNELLTMTFGNHTTSLRHAAEGDLEMLIEKNLWYLKEIEEAVPDWSKFNSCMDKSYDEYMNATKGLKSSPKKSKYITIGGTILPDWTNNLQPAAQDLVHNFAAQVLNMAPVNGPAPTTAEGEINTDEVPEYLSEPDFDFDDYNEDDE